MLSNREFGNRLHAGNRYVSNLLMLACNRSYVAEVANKKPEPLGVNGS